MEPEAGVLITMPGVDGAVAIVDASTGVASVDIEVEQRLTNSSVTQEGGALSVDFTDSGNLLAGILSVNQEAGNMNQQANIRSIAVANAGGGLGMIDIDVNTVQELTGNTVVVIDPGPRNLTIENSFNDGTGIVGINQAAGNMNQQINVVAVGIGLQVGPDAIQVGDAQLGQLGADADNELKEEGAQGAAQNTLANSFNDFTGIAQVSQVSGEMNRVSQVIGVSVTSMGAP